MRIGTRRDEMLDYDSRVRDPKEPYEISIPEDIVNLYRNYDDFILQTTQGNFIISLDFLLKVLKRSRGKLTGQLLRTRKHIVDLE